MDGVFSVIQLVPVIISFAQSCFCAGLFDGIDAAWDVLEVVGAGFADDVVALVGD